jgi:hypothetical protein
LLLQLPLGSQVPEQRAVGSSWFVAAVQAWLVPHFWQVPGQSLSTQQASIAMQVPLHDFMFAAQS